MTDKTVRRNKLLPGQPLRYSDGKFAPLAAAPVTPRVARAVNSDPSVVTTGSGSRLPGVVHVEVEARPRQQPAVVRREPSGAPTTRGIVKRT